MTSRKNGETTRQRILDVATRLFAGKGYRDTVHEEICRLARVNIAAINYHFRSKENLYIEAWRQAFRLSLAKHPLAGGVAADASAPDRFRGRIRSLLRRMSDPENTEFAIVHKEMANPTGLLAEVMKESLEPLRQDMRTLVRELLGAGATDTAVQLCEMSIMGQCMNPIVMHMHRQGTAFPGGPPLPDTGLPALSIETLAEHVVQFSLAGMAAGQRAARARKA